MCEFLINECVLTHLSIKLSLTIFYENVNFTNFAMEFRYVRAYGKTAKNDSRNQTKLMIQWYVTIKMRVNTTKRGFTVNRGGKNIVFSDNFNI